MGQCSHPGSTRPPGARGLLQNLDVRVYEIFGLDSVLQIQLQECLYYMGVEMGAGKGGDVLSDLFFGPGRPIGTVGPKGVPRIYQREDARRERYLFTLEPPGVAVAIPHFVVTVGDIDGRTEV